MRIDAFTRLFSSSVDLTAIALNFGLLAIILNHSNFRKTYRHILMLSCVSDIWLAFIGFLSPPVGIFGDGYLVAFSNGHLAGKWDSLDFALLTLMSSTLNANVVGIAAQFYYRYRCVCHTGSATRLKDNKWIVVPIFHCLLGVIVVANMLYPPENYEAIALPILKENRWPRPNASAPFIMGGRCDSWKLIMYVALYATSSGGGYCIILWCEYQILKHIRTTRLSQNVVRKDIHRALIALAICPLLTSVAPIAFFLTNIALMTAPGPLSALVAPTVTLITLVNPITTAVFVRPYRKAIASAFRSSWHAPSRVQSIS